MRLTACSWTLVVGLATVAGCKEEEPGEETDVSCATMDAQGGTVSSSDGVLTLSLRPGSLAQLTEVCIAPAPWPPQGPPAVAGPAYRVSPNLVLSVTTTVAYRHPLAVNDDVAIGIIRREDFAAGEGRWIPLADSRVEPMHTLVTAHDGNLSLYYGLLGADDEVDPSGGSTGPSGTTNEGSSSLTGGTLEPPASTSSAEMTTTEHSTGSESSSSGGDDESTSSEASSSSGRPTDPAEGSSSGGETGGEMPVDCANLPAPPFEVSMVNTPVLSPNNEDLAMLGDGTFLIMAGTGLMTFNEMGDIVDANVLPNVMGQVLGLVVDSDGAPIFGVGYSQAAPRTIDWVNDGVRETYAEGFELANGLFYATDGSLWASDFGSGALVRVLPDRTVETVLSGAPVATPNGIFFDEHRGRLYWTNYGSAQLWSVEIDALGNAGATEPIAAAMGQPSTARWDGITMDACGHIYIADQNQNMDCSVYRVELDEAGGPIDGVPIPLTEDGTMGLGCSALEFGYGFDSDADRSLFVTSPADGRVRRIAVGVEGYPIVLPRSG